MSPSTAWSRSHGRTLLCVLLVILQLLLSAAIVLALPTSADGLGFQNLATSSATYEVDARQQQVTASEQISVTAGSGPFEVRIPRSATNVSISTAFERSSIDRSWDLLAIDPNGASLIDLSYVVPSSEVRTQSGARVNDSFIGFAIWPTNASAVSIIIPDGYVLAENRGLFEVTKLPTEQLRYDANFPSDLQDYSFVAFSGESFESRVIDIEGDSIQIAGWIGDDAWLDHTERYIRAGVPALRELIGLPWAESGLQIVESDRPLAAGYAGWYSSRRSLIEISVSLNEELLLHELSHVWFNYETYVDRWIVEGLAEELASESLLVIDGVETEPEDLGPAPEGWNGLLNWQHNSGYRQSWEVEYFGYRTAWTAIDALADDLGTERLRNVLVEMQSDRAAYSVQGDPSLKTPNDWRRFLDVLEDHGNSTQAESIYREWVMPSELEFVLDSRTRARDAIDEFSGGDLAAVPLGVRRAMARWEFDDAMEQLEEARAAAAQLADSSNGDPSAAEEPVEQALGRDLNAADSKPTSPWLHWSVPLLGVAFVSVVSLMLHGRLRRGSDPTDETGFPEGGPIVT